MPGDDKANWRNGGDPLKHQDWRDGGRWKHGGDWNPGNMKKSPKINLTIKSRTGTRGARDKCFYRERPGRKRRTVGSSGTTPTASDTRNANFMMIKTLMPRR